MASSGRESKAAIQWRDRLGRFEVSGLTIREFCRRESVSEPSFFQWRKRLARQPVASQQTDAPGFVRVNMMPAAATWSIEFPGGARLEAATDQLDLARTVVRELSINDPDQDDRRRSESC